MISFEVHFDLATKQRRIEEISHLETDASFWQDNKKAILISQEKSRLENEVNSFINLEGAYSDAETMFQMGEEEKDDSLLAESAEMIAPLASLFEKAELAKLSRGKVSKVKIKKLKGEK